MGRQTRMDGTSMTGIGSPTIPTGGASADEFHALIASIKNSPILVPELSTAALGRILSGVITGEGPTAAERVHFSRTIDETIACWASRYSPAEIDAEVLRWIASHVKSKTRLGGPLMTIMALLVGASASPVAASLATVFDFLA